MPANRFVFIMIRLALVGVVCACAQPDSILLPPDGVTPFDDRPRSGVPGFSELLTAIQDATHKYRNETLAREDGYVPSSTGCEWNSEGSFGLRYVNPALVGLVPGSQPMTGTDTVIDVLHPEVLLYEPQEVDPPKLVGLVYVVYREAWERDHSEPPAFFGMPFSERFGADAKGSADYYEFTLWAWRYNPVGMFAPWNPTVGC